MWRRWPGRKLIFAVTVAAALLVEYLVSASDQDAINGFYVAHLMSKLTFNGLVCKSAAAVKTGDFVFEGFPAAADSNNSPAIGLVVGFTDVNYPALNAHWLAVLKIRFAPHAPAGRGGHHGGRGRGDRDWVCGCGREAVRGDAQGGLLLCAHREIGALPAQRWSRAVADDIRADHVVSVRVESVYQG